MVSTLFSTAALFLFTLCFGSVSASTCEITRTRYFTLPAGGCSTQTVTSVVTVTADGGTCETATSVLVLDPTTCTFDTTVTVTTQLTVTQGVTSSTTSSTPVYTPSSASPKPTTTPAGNIITPTKVQTTWPSATGETLLPSASVISGVFDGKMARFDRKTTVCQGQTETGEADTVFIAEDGATIANVILGKNQAEGIHCRGTCTLINVWHEAVCEDATTFKQASGTSYVIGGGARNAADKIFQFNGRGLVDVKYFFASNFGKVMRHCGNCSNNGGPRNSKFEGIVAKGGGIVVGINTNFGDTALISNSCLSGAKYGDRYTGVQSGSEPKKIGACPDDKSCKAVGLTTSC